MPVRAKGGPGWGLAGPACGLALAAILITPPVFLACGSSPPAGQPPLSVVASIFPLGDIARCVGGDQVRVEVLLPPGVSEHDLEPRPAQAEAVSGADLVVSVGLDLDPWAERLADASRRPGMRRIVLARTIDRSGLPGSLAGDAHLWLDPVLMRDFVDSLAAALTRLRPGAADSIGARAARFRAELDSLDRDCRRRLGAAPRREFVSLHAAFRYLASRYGLREVSVFETHMEEPGPGDLERVLGFVREARIKTIFVQPQLPAAHLAWLQEQAGLRVARLDPVGSPLQPGYDSYLAMMRSNIDALARGLGE